MTPGYWDRPGGLWSFWDMINSLGVWLSFPGQLKAVKALLERLPPDQELSTDDKQYLGLFLWSWQRVCDQSGFVTALLPIQAVIGPVDENKKRAPDPAIRWRITAIKALQRLEQFEENLSHDTSLRTFFLIPEAKQFGPDFVSPVVKSAFPSAVPDMMDAARCYAFGENRATVFHVVRAAEWGLKALARGAGVKGQTDYKEWGKIIRAIEDEVGAIDKQWPTGPAKANALDFYRGSLAEARAINNCWRTANLHVRVGVICDVNDAKKALDRMREFMDRLAVRISEAQRRPLTKRSFQK